MIRRSKPIARRAPAAWLAAAALALAGGCGSGDPYAPIGDRVTPIASPIAHVIAGDERIALIERSGRTFVFRYAGDAPEIPVGHIIVGAEAGGYVARVAGVRVEPGVLIVETDPASLTDAIVSGEIDTTLVVGAATLSGEAEPGPASPSSATEGGISLAGLTLLDDASGDRRAAITITEGFLSFNPTVEAGLTVRRGSIERFDVRIDGPVTLRCALSADIPDPLDRCGEVPLASFGTSFVRSIDTVPIVVGVTIHLSVGYEAAGRYTGDCALGYDIEGRAAVGARYRGGAWRGEGLAEPSMHADPLACEAFADTDLRIYVRSAVELSFYGASAAELAVAGGVRLSADAPAPPVWEWRIEGEIVGSAAIEAGILDPDLPEHRSTPLEYSIELAAGPFSTEAYVFVNSWGSEGTADGSFLFPRGIAVDGSKRCYVVDTEGHRVQIFEPDSTFIGAWGSLGSDEGRFSFPTRIAIDRAGMIYVVDNENHRIQKFAPGGVFLLAWGSEGTGEGQFKDPQGIAADDSGYVYVADCFTRRVQKFTGEGAFVAAWGEAGEGEGELACPMGIAVSAEGTVYVSECHRHRIQAFTSRGAHLFGWGGYGTGRGEFNCPVDVETDRNGDVYVVDYGNDRIQVFGPDGGFITELGSTGSGDGRFNRPEGIAVDADGYLVIVDSENRRVQRFAPKAR